jgi:long-subunit fatty acid transport protein
LLGVNYRSKSDVNLKGNIKFSGVQIPIQDKPSLFKLGYDLAQAVRAGVRFDVTDDFKLFVDADWEDWSEFSNNRVELEGGAGGTRVTTIDRNWKDTWHVGVAGAYKLGPRIVLQKAH